MAILGDGFATVGLKLFFGIYLTIHGRTHVVLVPIFSPRRRPILGGQGKLGLSLHVCSTIWKAEEFAKTREC